METLKDAAAISARTAFSHNFSLGGASGSDQNGRKARGAGETSSVGTATVDARAPPAGIATVEAAVGTVEAEVGSAWGDGCGCKPLLAGSSAGRLHSMMAEHWISKTPGPSLPRSKPLSINHTFSCWMPPGSWTQVGSMTNGATSGLRTSMGQAVRSTMKIVLVIRCSVRKRFCHDINIAEVTRAFSAPQRLRATYKSRVSAVRLKLLSLCLIRTRARWPDAFSASVAGASPLSAFISLFTDPSSNCT